MCIFEVKKLFKSYLQTYLHRFGPTVLGMLEIFCWQKSKFYCTYYYCVPYVNEFIAMEKVAK